MTACPAASLASPPLLYLLYSTPPSELQTDNQDEFSLADVQKSSTGGGAFLGLGAYSYFSGMSQLEQQRAAIIKSNSMFGMRSRRLGITSISLALAWAGLWRLFR